MTPPPRVAPFAGLLADAAADLARGSCCLVTADKGWTHFLVHDLADRLRAAGLTCASADGRPRAGEAMPAEVGVMFTAVAQLRKVVRERPAGVVVALPQLDLMAAAEGGWSSLSRELVALLYEWPEAVFLGFRDPTLRLLPVVEKLFPRRYALDAPFRPLPPAAAGPESAPGPGLT